MTVVDYTQPRVEPVQNTACRPRAFLDGNELEVEDDLLVHDGGRLHATLRGRSTTQPPCGWIRAGCGRRAATTDEYPRRSRYQGQSTTAMFLGEMHLLHLPQNVNIQRCLPPTHARCLLLLPPTPRSVSHLAGRQEGGDLRLKPVLKRAFAT